MSVLSDRSIKNLITSGVVKNTSENFSLVNPASLDLCVGDTAKIQTSKFIGSDVELITEWLDLDLTEFSKTNPYAIPFGQNLLVATREIFYMPDDICGFVNLKSSIARQFLQHMLAGFVDPGYTGSSITLELINHSPQDFLIYPGMPIAQIVFHKLDEPCETSYQETGRYNNQKDVKEAII